MISYNSTDYYKHPNDTDIISIDTFMESEQEVRRLYDIHMITFKADPNLYRVLYNRYYFTHVNTLQNWIQLYGDIRSPNYKKALNRMSRLIKSYSTSTFRNPDTTNAKPSTHGIVKYYKLADAVPMLTGGHMSVILYVHAVFNNNGTDYYKRIEHRDYCTPFTIDQSIKSMPKIMNHSLRMPTNVEIYGTKNANREIALHQF